MFNYGEAFARSLWIASITSFLFFNLFFIVSLIKRRLDVVDVGWGPSFVLIGAILYGLNHTSNRGLLVLILVILWAVRLSLHIGVRNCGKSEDFRYNQWRQKWGNTVILRSYFQVFLLQGFVAVVVSTPVIAAESFPQKDLCMIDMIGASIWLLGFLGETIADFQLSKFKRNHRNAGKLIQSGLWRYSRHPNYFFECVCWWGIYLVVSLSVPYGWATIISPLSITLLIRFVSGVPMLEEKFEKNPGFKDYKQTTNIFIPWCPYRHNG